MKSIPVRRAKLRLMPDIRRVLAKPYLPGEEALAPGKSRAHQLIARIMAIPEQQVTALNAQMLSQFEGRHRRFPELLDQQFNAVARYIKNSDSVSPDRRSLIGAYFTHEYAIEAAALFNPSIVIAPDQDGVPDGSARFVLSLRAVGEGHLSSIEFRSGLLAADGDITIDDPGTYLVGGKRTPPAGFTMAKFRSKLRELGVLNRLSKRVLEPLGERFTLDELEASLHASEAHGSPAAVWFETSKIIRALAASDYVTTFPADSKLSERVIFPEGPNETRGMEDARFVRFTSDDGSVRYFATYTAYDGFSILPQLIETEDFRRFTISTLDGKAAQNKGMALFPRPINGQYVMLSRKDRENLHLATSRNVHHWDDVTELYRPQHAWELLQIGNCGSPIETDAGWLVLTHGVGPMRRYTIGALLLDLDDPRQVIGHLPEPLMEPDESEREGYVPNVLYTCGALVHGEQLIVPYGFSDAGVGIARITLSDVIEALVATRNTVVRKVS